MPEVKDIAKLLEGIPKGAWVALSHDEERVVAYAADLDTAIKKAKDEGEHKPVVLRVPESSSALVL